MREERDIAFDDGVTNYHLKPSSTQHAIKLCKCEYVRSLIEEHDKKSELNALQREQLSWIIRGWSV